MGADLFNPESVKEIIAQKVKWNQGRRGNVVKAYTLWLRMHGSSWQPPKYRPTYKLPFLPTEAEIDALITGCSTQMATFLQLLKETASRCGEAYKLQWNDIDFINNTARITPEKGRSPRIFKLSNKVIVMLRRLPKISQKSYHTTACTMSANYSADNARE